MKEPQNNQNKTTGKSFGVISRIISGGYDYWQHIRMFSRNARLFLIASGLMGLNMQVFQVLLNLYLKEIGFLEGDIGEINSYRAAGMTAMALPAAYLLTRIRLKPFLLVSCVAFAVFSYFIVSNETFLLLSVFSVLAGMAFTVFRIASGPFFMRNSTSEERTYLFSVSFGTMLFAGMIGAALCGRTASYLGDLYGDILIGYQYTLLIGIGISLLSMIPFIMIKSRRPTDEERHVTISLVQLKKRGGFYFKIYLTNFVIGAGAGLIIPFLNLYFRDRFNLAPDTIGFYYSIVHLFMLAGSLSGPVLARKMGLVRTVVLTQLMSIPFMLVLSYSYVLPLAVAAFVIRGGLMNLGIPIVTNLCMELSDKHEHGLIAALLMLGWTSSWMLTQTVGGRLIEAYGYTVTMNITIALYIMASLMFFGFFRNYEKPNRESGGWSIVRKITT